MLKVLITPPFADFAGWYGFKWHVAVKQDVKKEALQLGCLFEFRARPTQRQIRRAKKQAKASFREYLNQGGEA